MEDIFKDAKFGDRFTCFENGKEDDCVFLEKMDVGDNCPPMHKLARQINVKYKDGGKKSFSSEIIADKDGNVYKGCMVGLTRKAVVSLLRGTKPIDPMLGEEPQDLVRYNGNGMCDNWEWKSEKEIMDNAIYSTDYLYSIYLERKKLMKQIGHEKYLNKEE